MGTPFPEVASELQRPEFETMVHMLAHAAREHPDHLAIISGENEITYDDYCAGAAGLATALIEMGAKGERVVVLKSNSVETSVAAFATWAAGGQLVLFNPLFTANELGPLITDAAPKVVICDSVHKDMLAPLIEANNISHFFTFEDIAISIGQWRTNRTVKFPEPMPTSGDNAMLAFTGGTTGLPKGAIHTQEKLVMGARLVEALWSTKIAGDIWLNVAPQSHIWGWFMTLLAPIYGSNTVVIVPQFKPDFVIKELARTKATIFAGGPSVIYNALLSVPTLKEADLSNLRLSLGGGSPFANATVEAWQAVTGLTIHEAWGMSEGAPISGNSSSIPNKVGSVGLPCAMTDVEVVDPDNGMEVLPVGENGEFRVKGPQMVAKYWNRPEETADLIRSGWTYTGDVGHIDEDGRLTIVDRKKDMVIVGGYNVFPREIDEVLFAHSDIQEAAAIGVPDSHRGEVIQAFVVTTDGAMVTADEIIEYCADKLAKFKVPSAVHILESLPKTPAAKIDKMALRETFGGS